MIIYATKKTVERYKFPMPEDFEDPRVHQLAASVLASEQGDRMLEWGAKLFYFERKKCLQLVHFASRLTIFLVDIKMKDRGEIGDLIAWYLFDIYGEDTEMGPLLERFFQTHPITVFAKLTDKSAIAALNHMEWSFLQDGERLYNYIEAGILHTRQLNREVNWQFPVTLKRDGKREYIFPAEVFAEMLKARFSGE